MSIQSEIERLSAAKQDMADALTEQGQTVDEAETLDAYADKIRSIQSGGASALKEENKDLDQRFWRGTKAEFDALTTKDDDVTYIVEDDPEQQNICKSYYLEFDEDKWTVGDTEATFVIPQSDHGLASAARCIQRFWTLVDGALISGAWADATAYTTGDTAENIIVHASEAFAGALMLVG